MPAARQTVKEFRQEIEEHLAKRAPSALTPRLKRESERLACGVASMDGALGGGVAVGALTELVGAECTGRTTMALAYAAATIQDGNVAAWIDVADVLDPECAAMTGVDLQRLLWVRCGFAQERPAEKPSPASIQTQTGPVQPLGSPVPPGGCGSPHPRSEGRGMSQAIQDLMLSQPRSSALPARRRDKSIGTPGTPNRPLPRRAFEREEQVPTDRLPPRRGDTVSHVAVAPRCAEPQLHHRKTLVRIDPLQHWDSTDRENALRESAGRPQGLKPQLISGLYGTAEAVPLTKPISTHLAKRASSERKRIWTPLDQALQATDLLLESGGFRLIVLDLGSTPAEMAWRIPLATWFRYRAACDRTRTSLLLLTRHSCAKSSAELVVRMEPARMEAEGGVLTAVAYRAELERQRFQPASNVVPIRKPPQSERAGAWKGRAAWAI